MPPAHRTRRRFLRNALHTTAALALPSAARAVTAPAATHAFSFILLGDLHYDKLSHHDMRWLQEHKAGDLSQINNYTRITADITPRLLATVKETMAALAATPETRAAFVLQAGDLVEGLCGTAELSALQNREAIAFLESRKLGVPFVFTKGNHDVTGDGAVEAFKEVFHPFLTQQTSSFKGGGEVKSACYSIEHGNAQFYFFDAYEKPSLEWLEAALAKRTAQHCFVTIHPPVVPYGARATWHLYNSEKDKPRREKLLDLLGKQNAFVLGGHIHRFNTICRTTPGGGRFAQLAISSVVGSAEVKPSTQLDGVKDYNGDQIKVEPKHSPETETARRAVYATEAPFVKAFSYADLPGHAAVTINGGSVQATMYSGITRNVYRTVDLTKLLNS
ncbi:MAG: metallophosphoesterase family protein [Prosthecobacter sp.]